MEDKLLVSIHTAMGRFAGWDYCAPGETIIEGEFEVEALPPMSKAVGSVDIGEAKKRPGAPYSKTLPSVGKNAI